MAYLTPNAKSPDECRVCKPGTTDADNSEYKKTPCAVVANNNRVQIAPRSNHTGGVNLSMCDGSVKFVSDTILQAIWEAALSAAGSESETLP
jgi:prepilin-type processing-associated H-X9-DG protein